MFKVVNIVSLIFLYSHDFIGEFTTSYRELSRGQSQFNVYEVGVLSLFVHLQKINEKTSSVHGQLVKSAQCLSKLNLWNYFTFLLS